MVKRKHLFLLALFVAFAIFVVPAFGRWGANWSSGSAIGSGTVSGLQQAKHSGASVQSVVAHPGTKFCMKKSKDWDKTKHWDRDDCKHHDDDDYKKDAGGSFTQLTTPSDPGTTPGVVFCKKLNSYGYGFNTTGSSSPIVQGVHPVNLSVNFNGTASIPSSQIDSHGNAPFSVQNKVDPTQLNTLFDANSLCPSSDHDDYLKSGTKGTYHPPKPKWTLVDFVPQQFSASLQAFDSKGHLLTQAVYDCKMDLYTLQHLHFGEHKPYTCTVRFNQ